LIVNQIGEKPPTERERERMGEWERRREREERAMTIGLASRAGGMFTDTKSNVE
jgi:hypothetical protein